MIFDSAQKLIGGTPLLRLKNTEEALGLGARLVAKLERFNLTGSAKDRVALAMIEDAERSGALKKGMPVIEPTSGNTGIGLAAVALLRGYRAIIVMPDTMSVERIKLMRAYGAEVVLSDGKKGMAGAIARAEELAAKLGGFIPGQFDNPANAKAHYDTTGPELWNGLGGDIDVFVAGVGTGGTITGVGRYLREQKRGVKLIAVEPARSAVLSGGSAGPHGIQGIGAGFVPSVLDRSLIDEVIAVSDEDALEAARAVAAREGVLVGISSGAAAAAAIKVAMRPECAGRTVAVLFPDGGDRYMSTALFG